MLKRVLCYHIDAEKEENFLSHGEKQMSTEGAMAISIVKHPCVYPQTQKHDISHLQKQCNTISSTPKMGWLMLICNKNMASVLDQHST